MCASLIELDPMSRPISSFDPRSPIAAPGLSVFFEKYLVPVGKLQAQGKDNLPFGVHPARHSLLHPVDGQHGKPGPPRQLRLAHQEPLPDLSDVIGFDFSLRFLLFRNHGTPEPTEKENSLSFPHTGKI